MVRRLLERLLDAAAGAATADALGRCTYAPAAA
jgi:hypothetical protein